jgi:hypothetical protein
LNQNRPPHFLAEVALPSHVIGFIEIDAAASPGMFRELRPVIQSVAPAGRLARFSGARCADQAATFTEIVAADSQQLRADLEAEFAALKARIR